MGATLPLSLWLSSAGSNPAGWILPGGVFDVDYVNNRAYTTTGGVVLPSTLLPTVRASSKFVPNLANTLVSFTANTLPRTNRGVLPEQAATNTLLQSQTFDNATWVKDSSIITADAVTAPDGTLTADASIANNASVSPGFHQNNLSVTNLSTYTISLMVKFGTVANNPWLEVTTIEGTVKRTFFNIQTGAIGTIGATSATTTTLTNGWFRFTVTFTASSTTSTMQLYITPRPADGNSGPVTGDGVNPQFYAWGAQMEAGSFATSYIPTTTVAVTRALDSITTARAGTATGGVVISAVTPLSLTANRNLWSWSDGGGNNRTSIYQDTSGNIRLFSNTGGVTQVNSLLGGNVGLGLPVKVAVRWRASSWGISVNGAAEVTQASGSVPNGLNSIQHGDWTGGQPWNSYIKRETVFANDSINTVALST